MALIRNVLLPRRLTQIYVDTKRSYEQMVQADITNPQLSSLHLKLRVQKDRLVAWGLEWADSKADHTDDIDGSLDRAGISDLAASIMSSIRELLDEAERIGPQSRAQIPGAFPSDKSGILSTPIQWTNADLARMGDIVKDISTSIDTLCDLSRSQEILRQSSAGESEKQSFSIVSSNGNQKVSPNRLLSWEKPTSIGGKLAPSISSHVAASTRIDPSRLRFPEVGIMQGSSPPSYENVANKSDDRVFACLLEAHASETPRSRSKGTPVLLDYGSICDTDPMTGHLPSLRRFEDLFLALDNDPEDSRSTCFGTTKLLGWFVDPHRPRYGFVYEVPRPAFFPTPLDQRHSPPSLLSFLQHGANTDHNNTPCLEDRFRLAFSLALSLLHVHAKGVTHRNINSSNIVFAEEILSSDPNSMPWKEGVIRHPLLTSFDTCAEDAHTPHQESFISSIYRHPRVHSGQRNLYKPAYDIYSLGIIFLEVGLWMPIHQLWKTRYTRQDFQIRLQTVYSKRLAGKCGKTYMRVVDYCLGASESVSPRTSIANQPVGGNQQPKLQTDFYWNALKPLERCCMIDEVDQPALLPTSFSSLGRVATTEPEATPRGISEPSASGLKQTHGANITGSPQPTVWAVVKAESPLQPGTPSNLCIWSHTIPQATRTYFDNVMMPKLGRMFAKAIDKWESYQIHACMAGETPESAKPTLLMVCRSIARARNILKYVNEDKGLFDIQVAPGEMTWSKRPKKRKNRAPKKNLMEEESAGKQTTQYQQKPTCGASLGCFVDEQNSEAVTFGGIVLVNGEAHGMSVHHMLEDLEEPDLSLDGLEDFLPDEMVVPNLSDDETNDREFLKALDSEYETDEDITLGDRPGTRPGQGEQIIVTQPALDDLDSNFFPNEDEMSDDHLKFHALGTIHASSGLRRLTYGKTAHEIDWALFKMHEDRRSATNRVEGGAKHCQKANEAASHPSQVLKAHALGGLHVHAIGSVSGLATGLISPAPVYHRIVGRVHPAPMWTVAGDFGVGGDSGAWIIDNATGGLCGHVLAYSKSQKIAALSPMEVLFHDMEQTLGANVSLPAVDGRATTLSFKDQFVFDEQEMDEPDKGEEEPVGSSDSCIISSADHNHGLVSNLEEEMDGTGAQLRSSPPLATSPPISSHQLRDLSLNDVANKWNIAQEKRKSREVAVGKGRQAGESTALSSCGLKARC